MNAELKDALDALKADLEGKSKTEIANEIKAFETKMNDSLEAKYKDMVNKEDQEQAIKAAKDAFDVEIKSLKDAADERQKHLDNLDVKLQGGAFETKESQGAEGALRKVVKENIDSIKEVRVGKSFQTKAVANMTTANLTGTAPRTFNFDIVKFPSQKVNIEDFVGSVSAPNGIYTYTVEGAGEGSIGAQTEGTEKNQRDYDFTNTDVATDFIAGYARYSKKMRNNLTYITNTIPMLLRRDYFKAENAAFQTVLAAAATASTEIITGKTKAEMLINEIGKLEDADYDESNLIVVKPTDYLDILKTAKQDLASAVTYEGGVLRVAGVQVLKGSSWLPANKYYVGDWSRVNKVLTEGLSLEFSDQEGSNFVNNNITARVESQTALAVEQPAAVVYGDFTAV